MKTLSNNSIALFVFILLIIFAQTHLNAQSLTWLGGVFGSSNGFAYDVSENGNVVIGRFGVPPNGSHAFRWSTSGGMQDLGTLPQHNISSANAVSSDGNVVVGISYNDTSGGGSMKAFIWTPFGGMQALLPNAESSRAYDVSADGAVIVGEMNLSGSTRPFRWTVSGGVEDLSPITGDGVATGISDDGTVIVGVVSDSNGTRVFRLINNDLTIIENPSGFNFLYSIFPKVSGNGEVVLSNYHTGSSGPYAFKWDSAGWQNLGWVGLAGQGVEKSNYNGSVMVGSEVLTTNGISNAFRWTSSNGIQDLNIVYSNLLINNSTLEYAEAISGNGRFIAGTGINKAINWYDVYIIDTQSNLHITEPTSISKFIAGETGLIKWTGGESGQTLQLEYSTDNGTNWFFIDYTQATNGQYIWDVPASILTTKAKIKITDVLNTPTFDESDKFKIKPYILTRLDANGDYYEFRKNRDQWGFWNYQPDIWPQTWWQQFNYQGTDPFTLRQYSQTQGEQAFMKSPRDIHPDWVSWVRAFGVSGCYESVSQARYNQSAILKWYDKSESYGGACFGIAATSALAFVNKAEFLNRFPIFPNFNSPSEVIPTQDLNDGVKRVVNELYTHQFGNPSSLNDIAVMNKTPTQLIAELKQILKEDNVPIKTLTIRNNNGKGSHTILPFKLEQNSVQGNIYSISVYDNSIPLSTNPITVDIFANSGNGSWSYPNKSTWGGNRNIFLEIPPENYLNNAILNKGNENTSPFSTLDGTLEIGVKLGSNITILDSLGNKSGYENGLVLENIPGSIPRNYKNGNEDSPYGYYLPINNYSVVLNDFTDGISNTFFSTGNKTMMYERFGAIAGQRDSLYFDGDIFVNNPDPDYKEITLLSLFDEETQEKSFTASGLQLLQDNSVKFENPDSNTIKIISYGVDNSYSIELNYVTENEFGRFFYSGVSLYPNMTQIFVPEWTDLTGSDLKVLIDWESDGIIDDSLSLQNQATDVEDQGSLLSPTKYNLAQNYPNPFNPTTKISWQSPVGSHQTLKVYDVLGNEVATLVDEYREAGSYEVEFDARNLSSGIYFYKLSAGSFTETKKMILMR